MFYFKSSRKLYVLGIIITTLMSIEFTIMMAFPIEIILKGYTSLEGFQKYFSEKPNIISLIFLTFLALFDLIEIFIDHLVFKMALPLIGLRVLRGFRTLYLYYTTLIKHVN